MQLIELTERFGQTTSKKKGMGTHNTVHLLLRDQGQAGVYGRFLSSSCLSSVAAQSYEDVVLEFHYDLMAFLVQ